MRPLIFGAPAPGQEVQWLVDAVRQIEQASNEPDAQKTADGYEVTAGYTESRAINPSTATTSDVAATLATFIEDLQNRR